MSLLSVLFELWIVRSRTKHNLRAMFGSAIDRLMATNLPAHKAPRRYEEILQEVTHDEDALEVVFVDDRRVWCQGSGGALGHPKVFYTIGDKGYAECMYCDRVFIFDPEKAASTGG